MEGDDRSTVVPARVFGHKATQSKTGEARYLRASTGSCHDFCKFGRHHAFDVKERRSMPKRFDRVSGSPEIKKTVVPAKPLSVSRSMDSGEKYSGSKSIIKREIVNDGKPLIDESKPSISPKMLNSDTRKGNEMKISSRSEMKANSSTSKSIKANASTTKSIANSSMSKSIANSSMSKSIKANSLTSKSIKANSLTSKSIPNSSTSKSIPNSSTSKSTKSNSSISKSIKGDSSTSKLILNSSTSKSIKENPSTSNNIGEITRPRRNRDVGRIVGTSIVQASKKLLLSPPKFSLSPKPITRIANSTNRKQTIRKVASPRVNSIRRTRKDESSKHENDEVEEKTLYVIKMETGKKPQLNCSSLSHDEGGDRDKAENTAKEAEYDSLPEIDDIKMVITKKGSLKKVDSSLPSKLNFRRGKVVEIQSQANTPRRLKFRQARLLGENPKFGDQRRRNLKKVEEYERKSTMNGGKSGEKVVLRHRDMQGKKDSRGLFNNVIEETASKLVETRKSKVKALVGAFETVISLQEIKSSVR